MNANDLKKIIEEVLSEMDLKALNAGVASSASGTSRDGEAAHNGSVAGDHRGSSKQSRVKELGKSPRIDDGALEDITEIDIKKQYLVDNPYDAEGFLELKQFAPCRIGIGKAGARYKTLPQLMFRAAHSAAQDAVFTDVDQDIIDELGLFTIQTRCESKDVYLTRPDLGRRLLPEAVETIKEKCVKHPSVQVYVSDGLSSAAVAANAKDVLASLLQGLKSNGISVGTPFFLKYGRVGAMDEISEITGADVTCSLIGERPGLITATSMSAYIAYKATMGMPEARRTVISNIHSAGTIPAEAGAHIADVIKIMLEKRASGTDLKL